MNEFLGKTVVITGANRGIGLACLTYYVRGGAKVYAIVRDVLKLETILSEQLSCYKEHIIPLSAEFTDEQSIKEVAKEIIKNEKKIDILINNVGVSYKNAIFNMTTMNQIKSAFDVNFFSPLLLTQYISKCMIKNKSGAIVFITSIAAFDGGNNIEYVSSKAAIIGAVRRLAIEYGPYNIRVNGVAPGFTDTDMAKQQSEELFDIAMENNIIKRMASPNEIAKTVGFLTSEESTYITGQIIKVSGAI